MKLTREQILEMPAGPEMDALVVERVMGWRPHVRNTAHYVEAGPAETMVGDYRVRAIVGEWHPSRDIAAAYEVELHMLRKGALIQTTESLHKGVEILVSVPIGPAGDGWGDVMARVEVRRPSLPEAVCVASLLAVLETTPKP